MGTRDRKRCLGRGLKRNAETGRHLSLGMPSISSGCQEARRGCRAAATAGKASQPPGSGAGERLARQLLTTPDRALLASTQETELGKKRIWWEQLP